MKLLRWPAFHHVVNYASALAFLLVAAGSGLHSAPTRAHSASETVIEIARSYLGTPYRLGATGPNSFDCSGLIFRIFADAGELPRIGGKRMRAIGYYGWFRARGMISAKVNGGERGDLVYYKRENSRWSHIGIYLGNGRVLGALTSGVVIHRLQGLQSRFVAFLKVSWSAGHGDRDVTQNVNESSTNNRQGLAIGTMNLRQAADPDARIIGWVSRKSTFKIVGTGKSPSGALWYKVKLHNGKTGWVYSRWVRTEGN